MVDIAIWNNFIAKLRILFEINPNGIREGYCFASDLHMGPIVAFHISTQWSSLVQCEGFVVMFTSFTALEWSWEPFPGWNLERGNLRGDEIDELTTNWQLCWASQIG